MAGFGAGFGCGRALTLVEAASRFGCVGRLVLFALFGVSEAGGGARYVFGWSCLGGGFRGASTSKVILPVGLVVIFFFGYVRLAVSGVIHGKWVEVVLVALDGYEFFFSLIVGQVGVVRIGGLRRVTPEVISLALVMVCLAFWGWVVGVFLFVLIGFMGNIGRDLFPIWIVLVLARISG